MLSVLRHPLRMVVHVIPCLWSCREHREGAQIHRNVPMVWRGKKVDGIKYGSMETLGVSLSYPRGVSRSSGVLPWEKMERIFGKKGHYLNMASGVFLG